MISKMNEYPLLQKITETLNIKEVAKSQSLTLEIQSLLKEGGFLLGKIDGHFGTETIAAYKTFKRTAHLEYPELLGASTAIALLELDDKAFHPTPIEAKQIPTSTFSKDKSFRLSGGELVFCKHKILGSQSFTWGEATKEGTRIPDSHIIVAKIVEIAEYMDLVKVLFENRPIIITSWFRPKNINQQQKGVSNSTHLLGHGVDFLVQGVPPLEVYKRLHNWHGSRGGLGRSTQFTHIDRRAYYARWTY